MQRYFEIIDTLPTIGSVLEYSRDVALEQGVIRLSYHVTPPLESPTSLCTSVYSHGYSAQWLELYDEHGFRESDPIPDRTLDKGALMTWDDAKLAAPNSPSNEKYFEAMREHGLIHGFGVPLFGKHSRDAYSSFDFGVPISQVDNEKLGTVRSVAQAAHQRICLLIEQSPGKYELSARETEVLQWLARGKSLSVTAQIIGIAPDTAKTYARRIYSKLGTSDRISAVIKAIKLGLVSI